MICAKSAFFSRIRSPAAENSISDGTDVAGIQNKKFTTSMRCRIHQAFFLSTNNPVDLSAKEDIAVLGNPEY